MGIVFQSTPLGSLQELPSEQRLPYLTLMENLPSHLKEIVSSGKTGAYLRGLAKSHQIQEQQIPILARIIFRTVVGDKTLAQLPALLSTELKIANDKAQKIAQEIERDLLAPVALELNQYLAQQKKKRGSMADKLAEQPKPAMRGPHTAPSRFPRKPAAPPNILNLKDNKKPPAPPPIPR